MRIAYLNTYGNGSTGNIVNSLKKGCQDAGIEAHSFYSREFCATPETSTRLFFKPGFYFDGLMTRIFDNHGLNSVINTKHLIKKLEEYKPDIIHIHNLHGYWVNYKLLFKYIKQNNIKVVFTLHDCWSFTGHCTHFDYVKCDKWKSGCHKCPQKNLYPKSSFLDGSKRNYLKKKNSLCSLNKDNMVVVAPSEWLKSKVDQSFLGKYNSVVINNGIVTDIFKPFPSELRKQLNLDDKVIVLAVASYWDNRKGLDFVIEAASKQPDWIFIYIGQEKTIPSYRSKNIIHIERTESQIQLAKYYTSADVYINPSLEETYPTTNLEAIACGAPVVTFNSGGSPEIVYATGYGAVVNCDTVSLINGIECVLKKKNDNTLQVPNPSIVDYSRCVKEYMSLYTKILEEK